MRMNKGLVVAGLAALAAWLWSRSRGQGETFRRDPVLSNDDWQNAIGAPVAGQSEWLDAARASAQSRALKERAAKASKTAMDAALLAAFREGAMNEVIVPATDPNLRRAQEVGLFYMREYGYAETSRLTAAQILTTLRNSGVKA